MCEEPQLIIFIKYSLVGLLLICESSSHYV